MECIDPSGYATVVPAAISYGVQVTASSANLLPATGTPTVDLFGYGILDSTFNSNPAVTVGGGGAQVLSTNSNLYLGSLQAAAIKVPQGTPGAQASISVTNANGTGTLANTVTYLPETTIVPATGLLQLLYDTHRSVLYALKAREVDVLDPTTLNWETPLQLPSTASSLTFGDMALSPDGTKMVLAASDQHLVRASLEFRRSTSTTGLDSTAISRSPITRRLERTRMCRLVLAESSLPLRAAPGFPRSVSRTLA